jgi:beta-galactosidase
MNQLKFLFLALLLLAVRPTKAQNGHHSFSLSDTAFMLDGRPFQIISGEMHYTRVPGEAWRQRMKMAKAMGLNTIGTYVFWNVHEPQKGKFDFGGNNDIAAFVKMAREEGLWVILRPSPYVCAEWEFGGYPYWLQNEKGLIVRSMEPQYLKEYAAYIKEVGKQLAPLQVNHGGNILMIQIENEYGSYGNDKAYLELNRKMFVDAGFDGLLYTCDPKEAIGAGHLPGLLPAINGVHDAATAKRLINENHNGKGPYMIAEWYPAWFDWWGTEHHTVPASSYTGQLDSILAAGISINMYMFHGGTTRGFMNGANFKDGTPFEPEISSYDYDAPLDEAGNPTPKFMAFRKVIEKHLSAGQKLPPVPVARPAMSVDNIKLEQSATFLNNLPIATAGRRPLTFEDLAQDYGFVLYRTKLNGRKNGNLKIEGLRDFAVVMVNGHDAGTLDRRKNQDSLTIELPKKTNTVDILVENMGRINFGKYMLQNKKGITGKVTFDGSELMGWKMYRFPLENPAAFIHTEIRPKHASSPVLLKGTFELKKTGDTYLDMRAWGKGTVWINGHNLGRYWSVGPQQTIYVPAEWLKKGINQVIVLELLKSNTKLSAINHPVLDKLQ